MKNIVLFIFLLFSVSPHANAFGGGGCIQILDCAIPPTLIPNGNLTNVTCHIPTVSNENNSYWEADLPYPRILREVEFCFEIWGEGIGSNDGSSGGDGDGGDGSNVGGGYTSDFYIFTSLYPFNSESVADLMVDDCVDYILITNFDCDFVELSSHYSKYIRIQSAATGTQIGITGIGILCCTPEDCDDMIDNDKDGLTDCEDTDCIISFGNPVDVFDASLDCNDGSINFQIFASYQYSIDGGPFVSGNSATTIEGLSAGPHTLEITQDGKCPLVLDFVVNQQEEDDYETGCDNGSFQNGTIDGWQILQNGSEEVDEPGLGCGAPFNIVESGSLGDPFVPGGIPLSSPSGNEFMLVLGDKDGFEGGDDSYAIQKCFEVTEENADLCFSFAVVLEDPDHDESDKPRFRWAVYDPNGFPKPIIEKETIISNDDQFFEESGPIRSQGFVCRNVDLSDEIGKEICIIFRIQECKLGGHGGYAYISGICQDCSESGPSCEFEIPETICNTDMSITFPSTNSVEEMNVVFKASGSSNTFETGSLPSFDLENILIEDLASIANFELECEQEYEIKIELGNGCGDCSSEFQSFTFHCTDVVVEYDEYLLYCNSLHGQSIPGIVECDNCFIGWSPYHYFDNPWVANPTFVNSPYPESGIYTIEVTDPVSGCPPIIKEVFIDKLDLEYDVVESFCSYEIVGEIHTAEIIPLENVNIIAEDLIGASNIVDIEVTGEDNNPVRYFSIVVNKSGDSRIEFFVELQNTFTILGDCSYITDEYGPTNDSGEWQFYLPNVFSPTSQNPADHILNPFFGSKTEVNGVCEFNTADTGLTSINKFSMTVFDRFGNPVYFGEHEDDSGNGCLGTEISWDGTGPGGQLVEAGVYAVHLSFFTCYSETFNGCLPCTSGCGLGDGFEIIEVVDVTMIL